MKKTLLSFIENIKSLACNQATIISPFMKIEAAIMKKSNAIKFLTLEFSLQGVLKQLKKWIINLLMISIIFFPKFSPLVGPILIVHHQALDQFGTHRQVLIF